MNKYVVAYIDFHSNVLKQELVLGSSELEVALLYLGANDSGDYSEVTSLEELKCLCFDMDSMISVYQV